MCMESRMEVRLSRGGEIAGRNESLDGGNQWSGTDEERLVK